MEIHKIITSTYDYTYVINFECIAVSFHSLKICLREDRNKFIPVFQSCSVYDSCVFIRFIPIVSGNILTCPRELSDGIYPVNCDGILMVSNNKNTFTKMKLKI